MRSLLRGDAGSQQRQSRRMRRPFSVPVCSPQSFRAFAADEFLDRVDRTLTISFFDDQVRARVSGLIDLRIL